MAKRRLGVAVLFPSPVAAAVDALRQALGDGALGRIPAHLTLVPPVNVREDRMDDALAVLRSAAAALSPFSLDLGPVASFHPDNPVLYLEVGGDGGALRALRDGVFVEPLARPLTWPFVPHVTVADEASPERIAAAVVALADVSMSCVVTRVHVLEQAPDRVWTVIADAPLGRPSVVGRGPMQVELSRHDALPPDAAALAHREWVAYDDETYGGDWAPSVPFAVVARRAGEVVGAASGRTVGSWAFVDEVIVAAEARGQGIGSRVLDEVERLCASRGCDRIDLTAFVGERAEAFYRGRGWSEVARIPNERWNRDTVRLRLVL
ncbi:MAG TPA: GNAT family N-acetyltransferase [Acidimicrobiales bacterium]|nr:GNAT family N-acetyltransferase [Acidimicrobiales bacterium]